MKRLNFIVVIMLLVVAFASQNASASNWNFSNATSTENLATKVTDPDLLLDCFENAVKVSDMNLAAKLAGELYGMNLSVEQRQRFLNIEDKISRKDYQVYRENLRGYESKSAIASEDDFVGDIFDVLAGVLNGLGKDEGWQSLEYHDDFGDGLVDIFLDFFADTLPGNSATVIGKSVQADDLNSVFDECEKFINGAVDAISKAMAGDEEAIKEYDKDVKEASKIAEELDKSKADFDPEQFKRFVRIVEKLIIGLL